MLCTRTLASRNGASEWDALEGADPPRSDDCVRAPKWDLRGKNDYWRDASFRAHGSYYPVLVLATEAWRGIFGNGDVQPQGTNQLVAGSSKPRARAVTGVKISLGYLGAADSSAAATASNSVSAAVRSSTISRAMTSGAGRFSASSKDSSRSHVMSRFTLSRARSSS